MGQLCPFVSFCAVLLSIKQKSKVSIQYNKIPLVKKDDDSIRTYRKTHKKGVSQTYDTPSSWNCFNSIAWIVFCRTGKRVATQE